MSPSGSVFSAPQSVYDLSFCPGASYCLGDTFDITAQVNSPLSPMDSTYGFDQVQTAVQLTTAAGSTKLTAKGLYYQIVWKQLVSVYRPWILVIMIPIPNDHVYYAYSPWIGTAMPILVAIVMAVIIFTSTVIYKNRKTAVVIASTVSFNYLILFGMMGMTLSALNFHLPTDE